MSPVTSFCFYTSASTFQSREIPLALFCVYRTPSYWLVVSMSLAVWQVVFSSGAVNKGRACVFVCVCVCVRERERERERVLHEACCAHGCKEGTAGLVRVFSLACTWYNIACRSILLKSYSTFYWLLLLAPTVCECVKPEGTYVSRGLKICVQSQYMQ